MPLRSLTPDESAILQQQGIDPMGMQVNTEFADQYNAQMSKTGAALATAKAHAGSYVGGGAGAIAGMKYGGMAGMALAGGPEDPLALITGPAGALIGAAIGGGVGAYGGSRVQQGIESPDTYDAQQQAAALAAQQHPYISEATDIGAGALASGGMFSPTTAVKGVGGIAGRLLGRPLTDEAKQVMIQAAINPALSTGMSLAQGQGMPSGQELAGQALGGAMFAKSWLPHGRPGTQGINEPDEEVNNSNGQEGQETPIAPFESNFTAKNDDGSFKIGNKNLVAPFMKQFAELIPPDAPEDEKAMIRTRNDTLRDTPYDQMREQLHQQVAQEVSLKNPNPTAGSVGDEPVEEEQQTKAPTTNEPTQEVTQKEPVKLPAAVEEEPKSPIEEEEKLPGIPTSGKTYNPGVQVGRRGEIQKVTIQNPQVVNPVTGKSSKINSPYVAQDYSPEDLAKYNAVGKKFVDLSNTEPGSPEHIKTWQEYEALRNKYGGMPPKQLQQSPLGNGKVPQIPLGLRQTLLNNKGTVGGLLHSLATTPGHPYQVLAKHLLNQGDKKSLDVKIIHDPTLDKGGDRSHYNDETDEIRLGTEATGNSLTALHEVVHAMTAMKIPEFTETGAEHLKELQEYLKNGKDENVKDLINCYIETAQKKGIYNDLFVTGAGREPAEGAARMIENGVANSPAATTDSGHPYGMGNLHEYVAEAFASPKFQKYLDGVQTKDGRTIWQHIVDAVRKIIGLNVKHGNMLDKVLRTSSELIAQNRPDGLGRLDLGVHGTNPPREHSNTFLVNGAEMVRNSEEKLGLKPNYNGVFNGSQLLATMFNKLTPAEQQIYKDQGIIRAFQSRKITQEDAVKWLEEHSPKAEMHTYDMEGKVSEAKKEYDKMTHEWYENLTTGQQVTARLFKGEHIGGAMREPLNDADTKMAQKYAELNGKVQAEPRDTSPRATSAYSHVSALPTDEPMPEWTTTKSGKNVQRVDVVIPSKATAAEKAEVIRKGGDPERDNKGVMWDQDNLHENLPNTLGWAMIQHTDAASILKKYGHTLDEASIKILKANPDAKIGVIAELQSRWAQEKRTYYERIKAGMSPQKAGVDLQYRPGMDHPLADNPYRLILKAAIEQAKKEGATHIMVSDAETAMMTERHDVHQSGARWVADEAISHNTQQEAEDAVKQWMKSNKEKYHSMLGLGYEAEVYQTEESKKWRWEMKQRSRPSQEPGMRLNYDTILPKIAEELTGSKGEKVSLGEHKNAYVPSEYPNGQRLWQANAGKPRPNLIFKNADGTPKTDVSGRLYPIDNVPDREPMLFGKYYAPPDKPEGELLRNRTPQKGDKVEPIQPKFLGGVGRFMTDALLRARQVAPEVSDAYHRYFTGRQKIFGDVYGRVKNVMDKTGFTSQDGQKLVEAMRKEELTKKEVNMGFFKNQAQKQVWNEYKKVYKEQGEEAVKDKEPVFDYKTKQMRIRRLDETSHPLMMKTKVANTIREATDLPEIQKLHDSFIADQAKRDIKPEEAEQNYKLVTGALRGSASKTGDVGGANRFNANRRAQGVPLPDAWTKDDFEDNLYSYASRNASDRSHFKNIESNPSVMAQLGEKQDAWGNPIPPTDKPVVANNKYVSALIRESHGEVGPQGFYTERAGSGLTTALFISSPALSAVHVPISNIAAITTLADNPIQLSKALWAGIKGMTSGIATAQKNGLLVPRARAASRMLDASLTSAERLQTISSIIRRIASFNDLTTKNNIGYMQAAMQSIIPSKLTRAENGDINAQQFMRKLDVDYTVGKDYTPDQLSHLATEAVGYLHGTNDPRTMPEWMLRDSEVSGFFSIAHWSVAQTDRFMRDVWMPAKRGNLSPLILGVCGAAVGGEVIKKLREEISGKHSSIPGLSEIINSDRGLEGNAGPLAYNAMAALQFAGFGGLFSQLAKYPFDLAYKNSSQALAFPLDEEVSDIAKTVGQVTSAIMNDPNVNFVDLARLVSSHILTSDFRLTREAYNQMINAGVITGTQAERKQLSDKLGQLRRFEQVEGLPFEEQTESTTNPYMYPEQQEFKKTQDIGQAVKDLPGLMQNIMSQYGEHPDVAMAKLRALKDMQYNTMPSLENYPLSFQKYVGYLQRMEGPQAAQQALEDYMHHKIINEAKSSIVP